MEEIVDLGERISGGRECRSGFIANEQLSAQRYPEIVEAMHEIVAGQGPAPHGITTLQQLYEHLPQIAEFV